MSTDALTPERRRDSLIVAIIGLLLFLPGLGMHDLWNPDEPRYAEVAREMIVSGEYFVPHVNGRVYTQKPPLQFWAMALSSLVTGGMNERAARLPAALAGTASIVLVFLIGLRLFSRRTAWLAAIVYATNVRILWQARIGQIDMLLASLVALAMWFWVRGITEKRPGFYRLFFVAAGLATLAKGPVGLLPPLLSIVAWRYIVRERGHLKTMRIPTGLLIWAAVVLVWLVPAGLRAGSIYLEQIVFKQNVTRYVDPWHHYQPWYYYLANLPGDFFPWSFLLPGALVAAWRDRESPARRWFLWALSWFVVTLIFFSLSPAKRSVYIVTMYPALALIVGYGLERIAGSWPRGRWWLSVPLAGVALILGLAAVAVAPVARKQPALELFPEWVLPVAAAVFVIALIGSLLAAWQLRRGRIDRMVMLLGGGMGVAVLTAVIVILPQIDIVKSARPLSNTLLAKAGADEPYAIWPRLDAPFVFYTKRYSVELESLDDLYAFANRRGNVWLLIERPALAKLPRPLPLVEVASGRDPETGYVLMTKPR